MATDKYHSIMDLFMGSSMGCHWETRNGPWPRSPSERRRKVSSPGHREGSWLDGCGPLLILFVDEMYHLWFNEWKNYLQFYLQFHQLSAALCGSAISGTVQEGLLVIWTVLEHSPSPSNSLMLTSSPTGASRHIFQWVEYVLASKC